MEVENSKMQNIALFLDEYLNKIGEKKFESTDGFITFKKGTFNIRLDAFFYRDIDRTNAKTYFAYIYPTDEKLLIDVKVEPIKQSDGKTFESARLVKLKERLEHGDLKLIVGESIIGQLARIAVMGLKTNWVLLLIVAVAVGVGAGGAGYAIGLGNGVNQGFSQAQHIINSTITANPTPIIIR